MALTTAQLNRILDEIVRAYAVALGEAGSSTYGIGTLNGTDRAADAWTDLTAYLAGVGDLALQASLGPSVTAFRARLAAKLMMAPRSVLAKLDAEIRALGIAGVSGIESYLTYYNYGSGGTNAALQSPYWRELFNGWKGGTNYPNARNLYFIMKEGTAFGGTTYANGLRKLVVGTGETAGGTVPTDYAGGVPYLKVTGLSGSGVVTVTGTEYNPATGARVAAKTWTATVSSNGDVALASGGGSAASANALIVAVSGISAAGGISAGTIIAEAHAPSGRVAIPF